MGASGLFLERSMSEEVEVVQEPARKQAGHLVTSENLAEFNANKLGLAQDVAAEAEPDGSEPEVEAAAGEKKQNPKLEKRFSELTKQREAARQEAERERTTREALEVRVRELESKANPPKGGGTGPQARPSAI
jgi:hypothetical protein